MRWIAGVATLVSAFLPMMTGCSSGDPSGGLRQPAIVTGEVTLDNRALSGGTVTFLPTGDDAHGREPGIARIESNGSYWIGNTNLSKPAGLAPGEYKVTVLAMTPKPDGPSGVLARMDTPERYANATTTPFVVSVSAGRNRVSLDMVGNPTEGRKKPGAVAGQAAEQRR